MKQQQETQLTLLKSVLETMDLGINRLVIAENGSKAFSSLSVKDSSRLISVMISEMMEHKELAQIMMLAVEGYQKFKKPVNNEEIKLTDLQLAFQKLPKNHTGIAAISDGDTLMVYAHGDMIEISANLCEAQQKDKNLRLILQSAVDVFRMKDKELHDSIFGSFNPRESFMKHFNEDFNEFLKNKS